MVTSLKKTVDNHLTATLRYALVSDKKMAVVAKMVKGKPEEALILLHNIPKKAARILYKVIASARANATNNGSYDPSGLVVQRIDIWRGPKLKRFRFASRSRVHHYVKHRSFVKVFLHVKK